MVARAPVAYRPAAAREGTEEKHHEQLKVSYTSTGAPRVEYILI